MSVQAYCDHVSQRRTPPPQDSLDTAGIEVLEGEAAELSHRIYFDRQQREQLERAFALLP